MNYPLKQFETKQTPFYYYDLALLDKTLDEIKSHLDKHYHVHYAVKANVNPQVLRHIRQAGLGCDCVSGGEIQACLDAGFKAEDIVFAGVGKSDWEINLGLDADIFCFNVESVPELEIINELAAAKNKTARVAFRINPNVGAHTHANIATGLSENKFGIDMQDMEAVIRRAQDLSHVHYVGLHFHIGSQILEMDDFAALCQRINELQDRLEPAGLLPENINVGGGLGIDYQDPEGRPIPNFRDYFATYANGLKLRPGQQLHFELGRAVVGQCGSLITRVLYVKSNAIKQFCIVDAGMTDLIRPALYDAYHRVVNLSNPEGQRVRYDVVGPICESSDVFVTDYDLPQTNRGDLIALQSAGAYGEIMACQYNCRRLPLAFTSEDI
ncbi:MAG: diaminopimelate decarboxylase [Bacteroidaceae bacterium]|nr:diaminopimelate decarboxylase [Prevotellaceae bacterium]MDY5631852.1 diaminopimelate decarboxylase [Bacteroidaceae bacterium]